MSLSVGIVGLPNVGKSTLFNALLEKQQAHIANFPFTTIEPNVGVVPVSDPRLEKLNQVIAVSEGMKTPPPIVPATVKFIDIAGLVAGAHKGEGLGNQFLAHIRETTVICHVLRLFEDPNVSKEGSDPINDFETVETELKLADLATLEKQAEPKGATNKDEIARWEVVKKLRQAFETGTPARGTELDEEEQKITQTLSLLTAKPILAVINIAEDDLKRVGDIEKEYAQKLNLNQDQVVAVSAKLENELAQLPKEEQESYLVEYAIESPSLERLIKKAYATLDLISFLTTTGGKEIRAWTLQRGETALKAGGTIHTDFEKNFIKADVIPFEEFVACGGWKNAREQGKVRSEGKEYLVQDGDVIEFKIGG